MDSRSPSSRPATESGRTLLGNPKRAIIRLSMPMIVALAIQTLYNVVDAFWVSGAGPNCVNRRGCMSLDIGHRLTKLGVSPTGWIYHPAATEEENAASRTRQTQKEVYPMKALFSYFDLFRDERRRTQAKANEPCRTPSSWWIAVHFAALVVGIFAKYFLDAYDAGTVFHVSLPLVIAACISAIVVFPLVYRNAYAAEHPGFVQLCLTFTAGIGFQTLFTAAVKAATRG